jgi:hypothetical protein
MSGLGWWRGALTLAMASVCLFSGAQAQQVPQAGGSAVDTSPAVMFPSVSHSSDSDGLVIDKISAAYLPTYQSGYQWQGVEVQTQRYRQAGSVLDGHTLAYTHSAIDPRTGLGLSWRAGLNQGLNTSLVVGEFNVNQAYSDRISWGLFASRDWVESIGALQQAIHYDLVGGSVDYQVHPRLTAIGSLAYTRFSDGQDRQQQRTRLVWDAWPEHGLTLQWAYKRQYGATDGVRRTYFNPQQLDESLGYVGWRRRYEGWQVYARAGWGYQKLLDQDHTPARATELQLTSPLYGQRFFKLRAGYTETIGLNGPGYVYRFVEGQWVWRL